MHIYVLMQKPYFFAVIRIILAVPQTSAVRPSSTDILSTGVKMRISILTPLNQLQYAILSLTLGILFL